MNRRRFIKIAAVQSLGLCSGSALLRASNTPSLKTWNGILFGAEASILIAHTESQEARRILKRCVSELLRLESIFTLYDERSELCQLNRQGELRNASPEFVELITQALSYGEASSGAFDITIHPVIEALRSGASPSVRDHASSLVDFRKVQVAGNAVQLLTRGAQVTLNGIAQGFITDKVADLLKSEGIENTLVQLGERRALGLHPESRPWKIGLAKPNRPSEISDVVELSDRALSSSGGYGTQFFPGSNTHHLVNPSTGQSSHTFAAVHVLSSTATEADALSTALSVCSPVQFEHIERAFPNAQIITVPHSSDTL